MTGSQPVVLFDGVCNLCEGVVQFVIKRDPQSIFRFATLQSAVGQRLLEEHQLSSLDMSTFVLIHDKESWTKSDAMLQVARRLSGLWPLLAVFRIVPRPLRDWLYSFVARNRYEWFGKKDVCMVPTDGVRARFLD